MTSFYILLAAFLCVASGTQSVELANEVQDRSIYKDSDSKVSRNLRSATSDIESFKLNSEVFTKPECTLNQRLEYGFRRTGEVLSSVTWPSTPERCALNCAISVRQCIAINYDTANNVCYYLKTVSGIYRYGGYVTALLSPSIRDICSSANTIPNYCRGHYDLPDNPHILQSAEECCSLCYITKGCMAYDYHTDNKNCFIKYTVPKLYPYNAVSTGVVCPFVFS